LRYLVLAIVILHFTSCSITEDEAIGIYVPINYKNCFDTIHLEKNGIYKRQVYNLNGLKLLDMKGKWSFMNNGLKIKFRSYYLNLDDDLVKFPELVQDTVGGGQFVLERSNNSLRFCVGYYSSDLYDQNCYHKL
jgi:hypothetical protein